MLMQLCLHLLLVLCLAHGSAHGKTAVLCAARSPPVPQSSSRLPAAFTIVSCALLNLRGGGEEEGEEGRAEGEAENPSADADTEGVPGALSDETLELLLKSEAENVGDTQSLREYADFLQESRKAQDMTLARTLYTRALQLDPACVDTHCSFGRLLHVAGQHDAAERHYKAALLLNPLHLDTLSYSAVLAQERRDFDFATMCYEKVCSPRRHACCTLPHAPGKQEKRLPEGADARQGVCGMQVLAVAPDRADAHSNYATLLLERAAPQPKADGACTRTETPPDHKELVSSYAARAEWHLEQALALQPANTHALYNYAVRIRAARLMTHATQARLAGTPRPRALTSHRLLIKCGHTENMGDTHALRLTSI